VSKLRVACFSVSLDGYGAGTDQGPDRPLGSGGLALVDWLHDTRTFRRMLGQDGGSTGPDDDFAARGVDGVGAWILGRNMFGPVRGPWTDESWPHESWPHESWPHESWPHESWNGWWGDEPPFHVPVFVLTHHARPALVMKGGTTFHFVTDGIDAALERAKEAAGDGDVRLGGGVATVRQYLRAGRIDELHLALAPVLLGAGEPLLAGLDLPALGYRLAEHLATPHATHVVLAREGAARSA
jgi:dihydrofolate reductase